MNNNINIILNSYASAQIHLNYGSIKPQERSNTLGANPFQGPKFEEMLLLPFKMTRYEE